MKIEALLHDEIRSEIEELSQMEVGSDMYKTAVDGITKLVDKTIDIERLNVESDDRFKDRETEMNMKLLQLEEEKKDRRVRNGITVVGIVVPTVVTIWGTLKSFKFEETGTVTTIMGRGFINKLLPKK